MLAATAGKPFDSAEAHHFVYKPELSIDIILSEIHFFQEDKMNFNNFNLFSTFNLK